MKRFTDTDIWKKEWFQNLRPEDKLVWFYMKDMCDNVGVWSVNKRLAEFQIGAEINWEKFIKNCNGNIQIINEHKWWLVDFCRFQHPDLSEDSKSKPIMSYIELLKNHGLYIAYTKGIHTLQGKGKGKGKGTGKGKGGEESQDFTLTDNIIDYFNTVTNQKRKYSKASRDPISARLNEGQTEEECKTVISKMFKMWKGDPKMEKHITIETLFRPSNFEKYLSMPDKTYSSTAKKTNLLADVTF